MNPYVAVDQRQSLVGVVGSQGPVPPFRPVVGRDYTVGEDPEFLGWYNDPRSINYQPQKR